MTRRVLVAPLVIGAALLPGAVALGWMAMDPRARAAIGTCPPCQKAKEQARLEGLDPLTKPVLWAAYTELAGDTTWTDARWTVAINVLANQWPIPPGEAAGQPLFYRLTLFATLERLTRRDASDKRHADVAAALARGLSAVRPATQVAIMLAIKGTPLVVHPALRDSLATLAANGEALPRRDAAALLSSTTPVPPAPHAP